MGNEKPTVIAFRVFFPLYQCASHRKMKFHSLVADVVFALVFEGACLLLFIHDTDHVKVNASISTCNHTAFSQPSSSPQGLSHLPLSSVDIYPPSYRYVVRCVYDWHTFGEAHVQSHIIGLCVHLNILRLHKSHDVVHV